MNVLQKKGHGRCTNLNGDIPLHAASKEVVGMLLQHDPASSKCTDNEGQTPLHVAAGNGQKERDCRAFFLQEEEERIRLDKSFKDSDEEMRPQICSLKK